VYNIGVHALIVNADDLGRTPGVSEGILRAYRDGIVSSTTVMVNLPGAEETVRRAREAAPRLGIGIHLNLTAGPPVLPPQAIPSLVGRDGWFYPIHAFVNRLAALDLEQVRAELTAQIERFRAWGGEPTHLDAHHHAPYLAPRLFEVLAGLAARYGLPIRYPWPREAVGADELARLAQAHRLPPEALPAVVAGCRAIFDECDLRAPDRCLLSFYGSGATLEHLLELIAGLPEGVSELMTHPGLADADLVAQSGYAGQREQELAALTDPRAREALAAAGVRLASFAVLEEG